MTYNQSGIIFTTSYDSELKRYRRDYPISLRNTKMTNGDWVGLLQEADHIANRSYSQKMQRLYIVIALTITIGIFWISMVSIGIGIIMIAVKRNYLFIIIVCTLEALGFVMLISSMTSLILITTIPIALYSRFIQKRAKDLHDLVTSKSRMFLSNSHYYLQTHNYAAIPSIALYDKAHATSVLPEDIVQYVTHEQYPPHKSSPLMPSSSSDNKH
mmetsp:Transcript_10946/g.16066  ORF Transcript_10946/g.16066 Transcript_10946/m.16066 type:complete len:214 (+) Transcript_10946:1622-2263(+)